MGNESNYPRMLCTGTFVVSNPPRVRSKLTAVWARLLVEKTSGFALAAGPTPLLLQLMFGSQLRLFNELLGFLDGVQAIG